MRLLRGAGVELSDGGDVSLSLVSGAYHVLPPASDTPPNMTTDIVYMCIYHRLEN